MDPLFNTGKDRNNKKALRGPPIDKPSFEIECLKKQLNISHTKIKELESKLEKSDNTNHILSERIKLFENSNNKDIYEQYFPSGRNQTEHLKENSYSSDCHTKHHHHCCAPPPCSAHTCHYPAGGADITNVIRELSTKVLLLANDIAAIKTAMIPPPVQQSGNHVPCTVLPGSSVDTILTTAPVTASSSAVTVVQPGPSISTTPYCASTATTAIPPPLSPDIIVLEPSICPSPTVHNMSCSSDSNTIDDNVPNDLPEPPLNSPLPTTQLNHQLEHTMATSRQ